MWHGGYQRVSVNILADRSFAVFYLNQAMPFGGVKASGHGRFGEQLEEAIDAQAEKKDSEDCAPLKRSLRIVSSPICVHQYPNQSVNE
jgi:hypothetical protein